jgi:ABC-type transport system involved in multi-copper enzyme maturation permease subunit
VLLSRGASRGQVLAAKYLALCVFALTLLLLATLEAVGLAALLPFLDHGAPSLGLIDIQGVAVVARAFIVGLLVIAAVLFSRQQWVG